MASGAKYKKLRDQNDNESMQVKEDTRRLIDKLKPSEYTALNYQQKASRSIHRRADPVRSQAIQYFRYACGSVILAGLILMVVIVTLVIFAPSRSATNTETDWWKSSVIYQCLPQCFQDSDGDGFGDLQGILQRAHHFTDVGAKAVWLNPIFDSPQLDAGYDVANYTAIYPKYGTLAQLKAVMDELHNRGIHLLLDFVPNHTSDKHPWFTESRSSKTNPKRDWYVWADPAEDGGPPNNWISVFGGSAWQLDNLTNQYYLHQFGTFQVDLNYRNPEVRKAMVDVLKYWLDFGVDGFRVDAVGYILEDSQLQNESISESFISPPNINCTKNFSARVCYQSLVHNLTTNLPGIHEIFREWRAVADSYATNGHGKILIGEVYGPPEVIVKYYGKNDEFTYPFNFLLLDNNNWTGVAIHCIVSGFMSNLPDGAWPNWVLGNHNNPRIATKAKIYRARALNVLLLTLPGTPTTYYGEELQMTDFPVPDSKRQDRWQDRDKETTPMQWNSSTFAGFTFPDSKPYLPINTNYPTYNVVAENLNKTSMLTLYKRLVQLRSTQIVFLTRNYSCVKATEEIYAYLRFAPDNIQQYLVVINFSEEDQEVQLDVALSDTVIELSTTLTRTGPINLSTIIKLAGGEAVVISGKASKHNYSGASQQEQCTMCSGT